MWSVWLGGMRVPHTHTRFPCVAVHPRPALHGRYAFPFPIRVAKLSYCIQVTYFIVLLADFSEPSNVDFLQTQEITDKTINDSRQVGRGPGQAFNVLQAPTAFHKDETRAEEDRVGGCKRTPPSCNLNDG